MLENLRNPLFALHKLGKGILCIFFGKHIGQRCVVFFVGAVIVGKFQEFDTGLVVGKRRCNALDMSC